MSDWIRKIKVGDILRSNGSGTLRIVRTVSRYKNNTVVSLTIKHCSWTGRCYTVIHASDLKVRFSPTGHRIRLRKKIDEKIAAAITGRERPGEYSMTCCDVEGIG